MKEDAKIFSIEVGGRTISFETGRLCEQSNGSCLVRCGETVVMVNVTMSKEPRPGIDFFPLSVDFEEKMYSVGKIPGGFKKREGKPSDKAILTSRLTNNLEFPFLIFLISGGHSQILLAKDVGDYEKIGDTIDDSLGECFDKVAQMLGLEYPGGPKIEKLAKEGDENRFKFVKPLIDAVGKGRSKENNLNFSFSGLKTAVRREIEKLTGEDYNYELSHTRLNEQDIKDISASFQKTIVDILKDRFKNTVKHLKDRGIILNKLIFAGGVSANQYIKNNMADFCGKYGYEIVTPPLKLCTDNGVMIAWAGLEKFQRGLYTKSSTLMIRSRWELNEMN